MLMKADVGNDVGATSFFLCALVGAGRYEREFERTIEGCAQALKWLRLNGAAEINMLLEPTGRYHELIGDFFLRNGANVFEAQPKAFHDYANSLDLRDKTDRKDGRALSRMMSERRDILKPYTQKGSVQLELRDIRLRYASLIKRSVALKNQLKCGLSSQYVISRTQEEIQRNEAEQADLLDMAKQFVLSDPQLQADYERLDSIPGIAEKTAILLLVLVDFRRFKSSRSLTCFLGLTPRRHQSGTSVRKKDCVSKRGSKHVRGSLHFSVLGACRSGRVFADFRARLESKGKHWYVIECAVARKLMAVAWAVIVHEQMYGESIHSTGLPPK
jgi:transposase